MIAHLRGRSLPADDAGEIDDVDALVGEALADWTDDDELIAGRVGLGVYLLARLPRPDVHAALGQIVAGLVATATRAGDTAWWRQAAHHRTTTFAGGNVNHGMAHGTPGIAAFLGLAVDAGIAEAPPLAAAAVRAIASWRFALGALPAVTADDGRRARGHFGWCYGEAGIAAGLCVAARRARGRDGLAGFSVDERTRRVASAGLLSGAAGVGLALLAASGDEPPAWDRLLLLS